MAHEEKVLAIANQLKYFTKHDVGSIMAHLEIWDEGVSAVNNSDKTIKNLIPDYLEKGEGYFKLKGLKGEHNEHSKEITKELIKIIKLNYQTIIHREKLIEEVKLIPDSLICLIDGKRAAVAILEVMRNEPQAYFEMKKHVWDNWPKAKEYLSELFNIKVESFNIINTAEEVI
ncbi:MAG TPA: hypothetical protein PLV50_03055 [Smithella sp.]|nr:hypothetical protein [Smithella sp.]HOG89490.1 hypothetical protein [Smithella sp.]